MGLRSYYTMVHILNCVHTTRLRLRRLQFEAKHSAAASSSSSGLLAPKPEYGAMSASRHLFEQTSPDGASTVSINGFPASPTVSATNGEADADPEYEQIGYQQIAFVVWGWWGRKFVDMVLICAQMGVGCAFLSLILSNIVAVLGAYGYHVSLLVVAIGVFPIVLGLVLPRSTTYLAGASHFGNLALLCAVSAICYFGATSKTSHLSLDELLDVPRYISMRGVLLFFGISAFSFTAHAEIVSVEADAESRSAYAKVLPVAMTSIVLLYMSVSIFAYTCFMEDTRSNVLLNLGDALLVNVVRLALSATLLVNYALGVFPASQALDLVLLGAAPVSELPHQHEAGDPGSTGASPSPDPDEEACASPSSALLTGHLRPTPMMAGSHVGVDGQRMSRVTSSTGLSSQVVSARNADLRWYHLKGNLVRLVMVAVTFFVAVAVQNLGLLFSVVGAVFGGALCYTLPPLFWYLLCRLEHIPLTKTRVCILFGEVALGVLLITVGLVVGIQSAEDNVAAGGH